MIYQQILVLSIWYHLKTNQVIASPDIASLPTIVEAHNYGAFFVKETPLLNGFTKYRHTIAIEDPVLPHQTLRRQACETPEDRLLHCESNNKLIGEVDYENNARLTRIGEERQRAMSAIPNNDISDSSRTIRSRRSIRSTWPPYTEKARKYASAQTIAQHKRWYVVKRGNVSVVEVLPNHHRERRSVTAGPRYCKKLKEGNADDEDGGFLQTLGRAWNDLWGQPTWSDLRATDRHICQLADVISDIKDEVVAQTNRLGSMSKAVNKRADDIESGVARTHQLAEQTIQHLNELGRSIANRTETNEQRMTRIEKSQELTLAIRSHLTNLRTQLVDYEEHINNYIAGINVLLTGRLPIQLVSFSDVRKILDHVIHNVLPETNMRIVHNNPGFYFMTENIVFTRSEKLRTTYITITIPIFDQGGLLGVYRVVPLSIPTKHTSVATTHIADLPDYLAVTAYRGQGFFTEMSAVELASCRGDKVRTCHTERSLQDFDTPTCAAALFKDMPAKTVLELCDFRYNKYARPSEVIQLPDSEFLVLAPQAANMTESDWLMRGPPPRSREIKVKASTITFLKPPCGFDVDAPGIFYIPPQWSNCEDDEYTQVVQSFPINKPMAHLTLDPQQIIDEISASTRIQDVWDYDDHIPDLELISGEWEKSVDDSRQQSANLKRLIELNNNKTEAFATRTDEALRAATDFHDLNLAHTNDLIKKFGNLAWLRSLTKGNTAAGVGIITFFSATSLIMSIIVCWCNHR
ncbi:PREDICTED: uncharacterized protein LOC109473504 [Branchiostoma belcheri]|uniref:Uncharacterized protein LOC109473504 n=1 Tax=Branchiostoma belcheri TaxID=7741 RepID=A0A6P4Z4T5_BRABE|nr:PREDICTED: uncharacterized protein LOC109473504 [Branchiostoma belcheri]